MAQSWHIGVIGGTGLYEVGALENAQQIAVSSSFGKPSGPVTTGTIDGVRFTFLARHGAGHGIPPGEVNYRANIDVLKRCGVTDLVSISAAGSLREEMGRGEFVLVDQFIDRTLGRERSFFGEGLVAHVPFADPVCSRLSALLGDAAARAGATVHRGGCYIAIEGPQFSTRAESHMYRAWGADVIGMTAMPEARLAREAELPYALLAMITDYDCWRESEEAVEVQEVLQVMKENAGNARATLSSLASLMPSERLPSEIDTVLDTAILTAPEARDPSLVIKLQAIAGRVLSC